MRRFATALAGFVAALAILLVGAGPALAQDTESTESVRGVVNYQNVPLEGVTITVTQDGSEIGTTETDAEGRWEVPLPEPGDYDVTLDAETLPDSVESETGQTLQIPGVVQATISTTVNSLQAKAILFRIGQPQGGQEPSEGTGTEGGAPPEGVPAEGTAETASTSQWPQLVANGVRFGLILGLAALGLSLVFGTTGLTNFSHGELIVFGAIIAWYFNSLGLGVAVAGILAVVASGVFGWGQDRVLWRPLRHRGTGLIAMMIISIGFSLVLRFSYLYRFGGQRRSFSEYVIQRPIDFGRFGLAPRDLWIMGISLVLLSMVAIALATTKTGKATRAVSDNPALAAASGIDVDRVVTVVWVVGTALAGVSGIMFGLIQQVDYFAGFRTLLLVFAAVILGGIGTAWGAMVGALIVGVFIEVSTLVIPSELKIAGALFVLVAILLVRPQGLLGRRERVG